MLSSDSVHRHFCQMHKAEASSSVMSSGVACLQVSSVRLLRANAWLRSPAPVWLQTAVL